MERAAVAGMEPRGVSPVSLGLRQVPSLSTAPYLPGSAPPLPLSVEGLSPFLTFISHNCWYTVTPQRPPTT